jgi:hypothetical protein
MTAAMTAATNTESTALARFLPGLVLGIVLGSLATVFLTPIAQTWARLPADPVPAAQRQGVQIASDSR